MQKKINRVLHCTWAWYITEPSWTITLKENPRRYCETGLHVGIDIINHKIHIFPWINWPIFKDHAWLNMVYIFHFDDFFNEVCTQGRFWNIIFIQCIMHHAWIIKVSLSCSHHQCIIHNIYMYSNECRMREGVDKNWKPIEAYTVYDIKWDL